MDILQKETLKREQKNVTQRNLLFYKEWLPLDKHDFRIMAMLADKGKYSGSLSDICRYFLLTVQTKSRNKVKESIEMLTDEGFITCEISGINYTIEGIPKEEKIYFPQKGYEMILNSKHPKEQVSWEAVLKVALWLKDNNVDVITNADISSCLNISPSTIIAAKNVLQREYGTIDREKITKKLEDGSYKTLGQHIDWNAFWA